MRIAQISPLEIRVPPMGYGGTELVVSLLTEELVRRGHEVTLFASGDSVTEAKLQSVCPHFLRGSNKNKGILNLLNVVTCLKQADRFDIIHSHDLPETMSISSLVESPVLTTFHTIHTLPKENWLPLFAAYQGYYNTISRSSMEVMPDKERFVGVIYNAIDCKSYPFNPEKRQGYLLFLSHITENKGPHIAIEVAKRLNRRLILAGNVDTDHTPNIKFFSQMIEPNIDGEIIQYVGEVGYTKKRELFANADCFLLPIMWPEPFGLVMVEAMACGTPVIAFNRGAAPELVLHGKTGFIVNNADEMAEAVGKVHRIDRRLCRQHVERNFDVPRMVDDYLAAYERILETERHMIPILEHISPRLPILKQPLIPHEVSTLTEVERSQTEVSKN